MKRQNVVRVISYITTLIYALLTIFEKFHAKLKTVLGFYFGTWSDVIFLLIIIGCSIFIYKDKGEDISNPIAKRNFFLKRTFTLLLIIIAFIILPFRIFFDYKKTKGLPSKIFVILYDQKTNQSLKDYRVQIEGSENDTSFWLTDSEGFSQIKAKESIPRMTKLIFSKDSCIPSGTFILNIDYQIYRDTVVEKDYPLFIFKINKCDY